jgi:hypothetical protein
MPCVFLLYIKNLIFFFVFFFIVFIIVFFLFFCALFSPLFLAMATFPSSSFLFVALSFFLLSASSIAIAIATPHLEHPLGLLSLFDVWNARHGRHYSPSQHAEKHRRFHIFRENFIRVQSHNAKASSSFKLGLNRFADMTNAEFVESRRLGLKRRPVLRSPSASASSSSSSSAEMGEKKVLAASVDWRSLGAVTGVKDQGMCGMSEKKTLILEQSLSEFACFERPWNVRYA